MANEDIEYVFSLAEKKDEWKQGTMICREHTQNLVIVARRDV